MREFWKVIIVFTNSTTRIDTCAEPPVFMPCGAVRLCLKGGGFLRVPAGAMQSIEYWAESESESEAV